MVSHSECTNIIIHWREERNLEERLRKKILEFLERQHQESQALAEQVERKMEDYKEKINREWNQRLKELREHLNKVKKENAALKEENLKLSQEIIQVREDNLMIALYETREEVQDLQ